MKKILQLSLFMLLAVCMLILTADKSFADDSQTAHSDQVLQLTVQEYVLTVLAPAASNTITASLSDMPTSKAAAGIGTGNGSSITIGNNSATTDSSYVLTNDPTDAASLNYALTVGTPSGAAASATLGDVGGAKAKVTISDGTNTGVIVYLTDNTTKAAYPTLGSTPLAWNGTATDLDNSTNAITYVANTNGSGGSIAPLDMAVVIDKATMTYNIPPETLGFKLTLTVTGI